MDPWYEEGIAWSAASERDCLDQRYPNATWPVWRCGRRIGELAVGGRNDHMKRLLMLACRWL